MRNIALILSYVGTPFLGWQKTPFGLTIEEALEKALRPLLGHVPKLQAASRTDAGVHAEGQVVNFFTTSSLSLAVLQQALNATLPREISIRAIQERSLPFHPTLDCKAKEYRYHICYGPVQLPFYRQTSWHFPRLLDSARMRVAAHALCGRHDFSTFCNQRAAWGRSPFCTLQEISIVETSPQRLLLCFIGDHFLYNMVRILAGTLAYVGCGKIDPEQIPAILESKQRANAGKTAPCHGLCLQQVFYDCA